MTETSPTTRRATAPVEQVLRQVREAARDLPDAAESVENRASLLVGLRQLVGATEAAFTAVLARFDAHGDGETLVASRSTPSWLRAQLKLSPGDAAQRVAIARRGGDRLAPPLAAPAAGTVTFDQVRAIHRSTHRLPPPAQLEAVALLTHRAVAADVTAVRVAGQRIKHVIDPDGPLNDAQVQFDRRYLTLARYSTA